MIQVIFLDHSELILSSENGNVTFITSKGEVRNSTISSDLKAYTNLEKSDPSMYKRLNYAKEMLLNLVSKKPKKQPMFQIKEMKSDSKENKNRFERKDSNLSDKQLEFYSTQRLNTDYLSNQDDMILPNEQIIETVAAGAAAEIRNKLANYNTAKSDLKKPDLRKACSYKTNIHAQPRLKVDISKSPRTSGVYAKQIYNFNTQRHESFKSRTKYKPFSSNKVNMPTTKPESTNKYSCKSGRSSSNTHF